MSTLPKVLVDERGTAFAEGLVVLPFFAMVLVGIVALHNVYGAKIEAKARARRLAWLQADSGVCPAQSCRSTECHGAEAAIRIGGLDDALGARSSGLSLRTFLRDVGSYLLGKATVAVGVARAPRPAGLGGGALEQRGLHVLLCNTLPRTTPDGRNVLDAACSTGLGSVDYAREVCR